MKRLVLIFGIACAGIGATIAVIHATMYRTAADPFSYDFEAFGALHSPNRHGTAASVSSWEWKDKTLL